MGIMQRSTHARLRRGCQYEEATGQKGVFRVAPGHHSAASVAELCVDQRRCPLGWAAWGEFGLRTSCVPSGQRTPLVSHGVTVGHHRPTP